MTFRFRFLALALTSAAFLAAMPEVIAQGWGGFDRGYDTRPDPRYGTGAPPSYGPPNGQPAARPDAYVNPNPRCRELEFQLSGGTAQGLGGQDQLPRIDAEMRQMDMQYHRAQSDAENANCYEDMFLFGRSLRRTPRCVDLDQQVQQAKARLAQLKAQRDALVRGTNIRQRREDIIAELARNRCGDNYVREYEAQRSRNSSIFSFFTNEEPDDTGGYVPSYSASTYRTLCVRLCDGFYFPISNATTESHFQEDEAKCHSQCAAPAELYYHRSDQDVEQMVSLSGRPYSSLPNAFRNRKVYIRGCSCNKTEYSVEEIAKSEEALKQAGAKRADAGGARKTAEAVPANHPVVKRSNPPAQSAPEASALPVTEESAQQSRPPANTPR